MFVWLHPKGISLTLWPQVVNTKKPPRDVFKKNPLYTNPPPFFAPKKTLVLYYKTLFYCTKKKPFCLNPSHWV